jgi:hypothetical protein
VCEKAGISLQSGDVSIFGADTIKSNSAKNIVKNAIPNPANILDPRRLLLLLSDQIRSNWKARFSFKWGNGNDGIILWGAQF